MKEYLSILIYANDDGRNGKENFDDNNKHNNSTLFQCLHSILITDYENFNSI
jgi:hypothetical protein